MRRLWTPIAVMGALALVACGSGPEDASSGAMAGGARPNGPGDAKPSAVQEEAYFSLRPDHRPCAAPLCGGFWVKRVNATRTLCADGQWSQSCYVAELALAPLGLTPLDEADLRSDVARVLVRGRAMEREFPGTGALGALEVSEAWRAPPGVRASRGTFFMLEGEGAAMTAQKLNSTQYPQKIAAVDFDAAPGTTADKSEAFARIGSQGLVVAGADVPERDEGVGLDVSDFFARVAAE